MSRYTTLHLRRQFARVLRSLFILFLLLCCVLVAVELVRPGLVRRKLHTAYFLAKAETWNWGSPPGGLDLSAIEPFVVRWLAPAQIGSPSETSPVGVATQFSELLPQSAGSLPPPDIVQTPLSAAASTWKYLDDGSDQGISWREPAFDDMDWMTGQAPLGFGQGNDAAHLTSDPLTGQMHHTTYFRREFTVADPSIYRMLDLELLRDDGAVVYLNGREVFRSNLPSGEITFQTPALTTVIGLDETIRFHQPVDAAALRPGRNVLAVELHQAAQANKDGSFDLILRGALIPASVRFAVIGDFGAGGAKAKAVSDLVKSWNPDIIITTGDNNYPSGKGSTIDKNVGQFYHSYIAPYYGKYGPGADQNRFFPTMGNHEWGDVPDAPSLPYAYLNYFTLPPGQGDERYYDFQWGPVQFFALDSDINEPDGITSTSTQALWLKEKLQQSEAPWKLVYMHHPPYSSTATHPPTGETDWPYAEWGASLVISGHDHYYERIERNNLPYLINGIGGGIFYPFGTPVDGSQVRFTGVHGAMLVQAGPCNLVAWLITIQGAVIDTFQLANPAPACQ